MQYYLGIAGTQTDWLQSDLTSNAQVAWKMAQYHKPMRPHASGKPEGHMQYKYWAKLFSKHQVKLVVECDAHTVKTTWPVIPSVAKEAEEGFIRNDSSGTVYIGEGCWGAPLRPNNDKKNWTRASGKFNQLKWIFVDQKKIEIRTIKVGISDSVRQVDDKNMFEVPDGLDIWSPESGAVVTIEHPDPQPTVEGLDVH